MKITRFGFSLLVLIWLVPVALIDIYGNTVNTGQTAQLYYFATLFDGLLGAYAAFQLFRPETADRGWAQNRVNDPSDTVVEFVNPSAIEWIYCAILAVYALVNFYADYRMNTEATGLASIASMLWSYVSIAVAIVSGIQFYHLKSGSIVELKHKALG